MKSILRSGFLAVASLLVAFGLSADHVKSIPVVTQIQGATFYRTSVTVSNANPTITTPVSMLFSYRSPSDGSFQTATFDAGLLGPRRVVVFEDVVQAFKDAGAIRSQDRSAGLFGTLLVTWDLLDIKAEAAAVARTYSPATGGGTLGFAYAGRCFCLTGSQDRVLGAARSGVFGNDGSTRANVGIINEGFGPSDVTISYFDGGSGALLKTFLVSSRAGHILQENEVYQLNNVFAESGIPSGTRTMVVEATAVEDGNYVSVYGVQLDNTTNDGSFFFMEEE